MCASYKKQLTQQPHADRTLKAANRTLKVASCAPRTTSCAPRTTTARPRPPFACPRHHSTLPDRFPARTMLRPTLLTALLLATAGQATAVVSPSTCLLASALARARDVPDTLRADLDALRGDCSAQGDVGALERCLVKAAAPPLEAALLEAAPLETALSMKAAPAPLQVLPAPLTTTPAHRRLSTTCAFQTATSGSHDVPANCSQTAEVILTADMMVQGQGATIDRGGGGRHFQVPSGVTLVLRWLRLVRGWVSTSQCSGPYLACYGGIAHVRGTIDMWRVDMSGGRAYYGGAVWVVRGALSMNKSTIHGNSASYVSEPPPCAVWRHLLTRFESTEAGSTSATRPLPLLPRRCMATRPAM